LPPVTDNGATIRPIRIVAMGGGTGLSTLLRGMKHFVAAGQQPGTELPIADLAAIVTVTDDGGSSGRLRRDYRILPPGDIRKCMVALSQDEALLSRLFQYRFQSGRGLQGHSFGNLFLAALTHVTGDFTEAVRLCSEVLAIRGRIFPSTPQLVSLEAVKRDGTIVAGESKIWRKRGAVRRVRLVPRRVRPPKEVLQAIRHADLIVTGPGSLYTSIIPNLLVQDIAAAMRRSRATRVYIANLMTQPGETDGYTVADHVRAIYAHTGGRTFDWVVINHARISPALLRHYRADGAEPVVPDVASLQRLGLRCVFDDLVEEDGVVRHDSARLTRLLLEEFVPGRPRL
jgi:uncharacterized cofD-like protein